MLGKLAHFCTNLMFFGIEFLQRQIHVIRNSSSSIRRRLSQGIRQPLVPVLQIGQFFFLLLD